MVPAITDERVVSPYEELMAFEYLYATRGTSRSKLSRLFAENGIFPTRALATVEGLVPDESTYGEVKDYVDARIGDFSVLVEGTPQFPSSLRTQIDPLPIVYYRGDLSLIDTRSVSVVGTRHPSERGARAAQRIARALAEREITVVAGLALDIDTEAITEAIACGGSVIGVIGTPIDRYYPRENRTLQDGVATSHLLISQVPLYRYDHQPFDTRHSCFRERNVAMAALLEATIIVEAYETSGTRTKARLHRPAKDAGVAPPSRRGEHLGTGTGQARCQGRLVRHRGDGTGGIAWSNNGRSPVPTDRSIEAPNMLVARVSM